MNLPEPVKYCISRLEQAGFSAYAVGGCVRDALLGLTPHDYDLCTQAAPEDTIRIFSDLPLVTNGVKHGTVGVVLEGQVYEITTFRQEGDYRDGRHPGWVRFVPSVREDLGRRDFTVNAMAYSPRQGYMDPWGGRQDLEKKILRAVGDPETRFREDALRILRGVRFAVRFDLTPEPETLEAMIRCSPLMDRLAPERVFSELCKLLPRISGDQLLTFAPILTRAVPELAPCVGFRQYSPYHKFDVFTHIAHVTEAVPDRPAVRWAALLHDVGKPATFTRDSTGRGHFHGHAAVGAQMADRILLRLRAPTRLREQVVFLVKHHMDHWEPEKSLMRRRLGKYGEETCRDLLSLQQADFCSKGAGARLEDSDFPALWQVFEQVLGEEACLTVGDLQVSGRDLLALGLPAGPELGQCLQWLLDQVQKEQLPNERQALLDGVRELWGHMD